MEAVGEDEIGLGDVQDMCRAMGLRQRCWVLHSAEPEKDPHVAVKDEAA